MSFPPLQRWLTDDLIRRVEHAAVDTLLRDGPVAPDGLAQIVRGRSYVHQLRTDPRLQPVRDLYDCMRRNSPMAVLTLADGVTLNPRAVWKRVRRHLYVLPSETFGMLSDHPQVDWIAAHLRAGSLLESAAEGEPDAARMEWLYSQAAVFYGAAALWVREQSRAGILNVRDLDDATRRKLSELGKYAPWLQGRLLTARTRAEAEENSQSADLRRRHDQNTLLMPEFLRQFFQGGTAR